MFGFVRKFAAAPCLCLLLLGMPGASTAAPEVVSALGPNIGTEDSGTGLVHPVLPSTPLRSPVSDDGNVRFISEAVFFDPGSNGPEGGSSDTNGVADLYERGGLAVDLSDSASILLRFAVDATGTKAWMFRIDSASSTSGTIEILGPPLNTNGPLLSVESVPDAEGGGGTIPIANVVAVELSGDGLFAVYSSLVSPYLFLHDIDTAPSAPEPIAELVNGGSTVGGISDDGEIVVFSTSSDNLLFDPNGIVRDVLVYTKGDQQFRRVSIRGNEAGAQDAVNPHVSRDGAVIVFESADGTLTADDADDGSVDLFVESAGTLTRIPVGANIIGLNPRLNGDGRFVVFSTSVALTEVATGGKQQIYHYDLSNGSVKLISQTSEGQAANDNCFMPDLSPSGRYVSFVTKATNLAAGTGGKFQVYRKDLGDAPQIDDLVVDMTAGFPVSFTPVARDLDGDAFKYEVAELPVSGTLLNKGGAAVAVGIEYTESDFPWSFTGPRTVAFTMFVREEKDGGLESDLATITIADAATGFPKRLSEPASGISGEGDSYPIISRGLETSNDGSRTVFTSSSKNFLDESVDPIDFGHQIYLKNGDAGELTHLSAGGVSAAPAISGDGTTVAWWFMEPFTGGFSLKVATVDTGAVTAPDPLEIWSGSRTPSAMSVDGRYVFFNTNPGVRLWDRVVGGASTSVDPIGRNAAISDDGNWLAWERDGASDNEIIVRSRDGSVTLSAVSGSRPRLSEAGRYLLYLDANGNWQRRDLHNGADLFVAAGANASTPLSQSGRFVVRYENAKMMLSDLGGGSVVNTEVGAVGHAAMADVSADGTRVVFSTADNLLGAADLNGKPDVYAWQFPAWGNALPVPGLTSISVDEETRFSSTTALASDADGDDLVFELVTLPSYAKAENGFVFMPPAPGLPNGLVEYEPIADYFGTDDFFEFRVRDASGTWVEQKVSISVIGQPDDPTLSVDKRLIVFSDESAGLIDTDILSVADVDDPAGLVLSTYILEVVTPPAGSLKDKNGAAVGGQVTLDLLPLSFTPVGDGADQFTVRIQDPTGRTSDEEIVKVYSGATRMSLSLFRGWNAVSFAVAPLVEARAAVADATGSDRLIFPIANGRRLRRRALSATDLLGRQGFFVYAPEAINLPDLPGDPSGSVATIERGWNLIGPDAAPNLALPATTRIARRLNDRGRLEGADEFTAGEALWLFSE